MSVELTTEAKAILKAAAGGDGYIGIQRFAEGGVIIMAGGQNLIPNPATHRTVQMWIGGLEDLKKVGYIRPVREEFEVTREGYSIADTI